MSTKRETDTIEVRDPEILRKEYEPQDDGGEYIRLLVFETRGEHPDRWHLRPGDVLIADTGEDIGEITGFKHHAHPTVSTHYVYVDYGAGDYWDSGGPGGVPLGELAKQIDEGSIVAVRRNAHGRGPLTLDISPAGRYENVFIDEKCVASYDRETGEFVVYDPYNDSEDAEYVVGPD